jgi:chorismate lyase
MNLRNRRIRGCDAGGWRAFCSASGALRAWLTESGSLTACLQRYGETTVQVLRQGPQLPGEDERRVLSLAAGRIVPVRDVVLRVQGRVAVYAHTVANRAAWRLLHRAGGRPLATVLFADPRVKAGPLRYRSLDARHALYRAAAEWGEGIMPQRLTARRALFARGAAHLLVTEVFLPWS